MVRAAAVIMEGVKGTGTFRLLLAKLPRRHAAPSGGFAWTPEAERMRSALDMHEFGVQLYRQRMRREHPGAGQGDIDGLVRAWLTSSPPDTRLRLPSREHRGFAG
jgi:hypothetical protein